jgi:hypothetical protein
MSLPSYELELRASEERKRMHLILSELKAKLRERAALKPMLHRNLLRFAAAAAMLGLATGYGFGGFFRSNPR